MLAILVGRIVSWLTRFLKIGGGSAAPGFYALKIDPNLVEKLSKKIPRNIVITGTNGKTTTARMIAHFAKDLKVIRNVTGSNLERGIVSALINHSGKTDLGIWELDEFAFNSVAPKIKPDIVLFLNVSRDQLDRYGEVDKVVNRWCETISKLDPKTIILIHPDLAKLKKYFKGIKEFEKPKNIKTKGLEGSEFELFLNHKSLIVNLPIPGIYNINNAVAAITATHCLNIPISSLAHFQPAFGRFEKLPFGYIFLIKNPAGATEVFKTISSQIKPEDRLLLALNDNLADGRDVSWIWDTEFEKLQSRQTICSGTRAADLAVRLKYAGFDPKQIKIEPG
ncbi:MAG: MurT ligase domain-containing protein, partial [Candidatus Daviesbacteria bacterium]|nr:MurT ligase domain-containing protein [Candidatus Daviesbacteria bacterium]